jgi:hypothetical protein
LGIGSSSDEAQELRREAVARSVEARRVKMEASRMTLLERIAVGLEERASDILAAYLHAGLDKGDWRALEALVTRVYGRPVERTEDVTERHDVYAMSPRERDALRAKLIDSLRDPSVTQPLRLAQGEG